MCTIKISKRTIWWLLFILALSPSLFLLSAYMLNPRLLGVDSTEVLLKEMGEWAIRFLILSLMCSPAKRLGFKQLLKYRRMFGLFSFYYGSIHLSTYLWGWIEFDWPTFKEDILDRPFIYLGMISWLILFVLAVTSFKRIVKILKRKWGVIHRLVYLAVGLVWIHVLLQSRSSAADAVMYGLIILALMLERIYQWALKRKRISRLV